MVLDWFMQLTGFRETTYCWYQWRLQYGARQFFQIILDHSFR